MKVIVNKFIPFPGFVAMAVYGSMFVRKEYEDRISLPSWKYTINHESIHIALMKDFCKWIPVGGTIFYICYLLEWLVRLFLPGDAYRNISFEKEAYNNQRDLKYLNNRKRFAQWNSKN